MTDADLNRQVQELRSQLEALLSAAHANEQKLDRFDRVERRLMSVGSVEKLVHMVLHDCRADFGLDVVELWLLDLEDEWRRALPAESPLQPRLLDSHVPLTALYGTRREPILVGRSQPELARAFAMPTGLGSAALLPLLRQGVLIGSLHLGSRDPQRYEHGTGTKFLERMAAIAAISIENTLNRERLRQAGMTDALTGLHNRRYFDHRCPIEVSQALRHRYPLGCLFLDVDHFKAINDGHGHPTGDEVLRQIGAIVQRSLRQGDIAARFGGEEFVVLLPRATQAGVHEVAERIRLGVQQAELKGAAGQRVPVTLSVGLAMLPLNAPPSASNELVPELLRTADQALYRAKQGGRNRTALIAS